MVRDEGLYQSTKHFLANYVSDMVQELVDHGDPQALVLHEDKDLRQVQIILLEAIASGFGKCKELAGDLDEPLPTDPREAAKKKENTRQKVHQNEGFIEQITSMGFSRADARRALKLTGDVSNAVTFLLESGEAGLDQVSDSEEEGKQANDGQNAAEEGKQREKDEQDAREARNEKRKESLISFTKFKEELAEIQAKGL